MSQQLKTHYEHSAELREARRQEAAASIAWRYALAEKVTGMSTAERVASAARKRTHQQCPIK